MKKIFNLLTITFIFIFLIFNNSKAANVKLSKSKSIGEPSALYDGLYKYNQVCNGRLSEPAWEGSSWLIINGYITNDQTGAGKWNKIDKKSRIDKDGNIYIKGMRSHSKGNDKGIVTGNINEQNTSWVFSDRKKISKKWKYFGDKVYGMASRLGDFDWFREGGGKCVFTLTKLGEVPERYLNDKLNEEQKFSEIEFNSRSPQFERDVISKKKGKKIKIKAKIRNLNKLSEKGLAIILPSSTPNMDDEMLYENQASLAGYTTAVVYGADPRFGKKFKTSYTSSMILYDAISFIDTFIKNYSKPKEIILIASSTGSLAIIKAGWQEYIDFYPNLNLVSKVFMLNAACPEFMDVEWNNNLMVYAISGKNDDSIPPSACKNLKYSKNYKNIHLLNYDGVHHFESSMYGTEKYEENDMHLLMNCKIHFKENLYLQMIVKKTGDTYDMETDGASAKGLIKWQKKNCLGKGNHIGYNEVGATNFWKDFKSILVDNEEPANLIGYIN